MKNKKGFIFGGLGLIYMFTLLAVVGLLVWFGFRISAGLVALTGWLSTWWWVILIILGVIIFRSQVRAILNTVLGKLGVSV